MKILFALIVAVVIYVAILKLGPLFPEPPKKTAAPAPSAQSTPYPDRPLSPAEIAQPGTALRRPITRTQDVLNQVKESRREDR